jgi:putative toxin-antitoxin system antitoxin component (TIGR02293 family)
MATTARAEFSSSSRQGISPLFELTNKLLGGRSVLRRLIHDEVEAHLRIVEGIPTRAMLRLIADLHVLTTGSVLLVMRMSARNFHRRKEAAEKNPAASLTVDEGSRLWKFTELLAQATRTLGSQEAAERWLNNPQIGLDGKRPVELLTTTPGAELVADLLTRMDYGVYT